MGALHTILRLSECACRSACAAWKKGPGLAGAQALDPWRRWRRIKIEISGARRFYGTAVQNVTCQISNFPLCWKSRSSSLQSSAAPPSSFQPPQQLNNIGKPRPPSASPSVGRDVYPSASVRSPPSLPRFPLVISRRAASHNPARAASERTLLNSATEEGDDLETEPCTFGSSTHSQYHCDRFDTYSSVLPAHTIQQETRIAATPQTAYSSHPVSSLRVSSQLVV